MLTFALVFYAIIVITCALLNNASSRRGIPVLLAFLFVGIVAGNTGILEFNDFNYASDFSTVALIIIMFYGGFGTSWKSAKSVAVESSILASLGVIVTAAVTGVCCHFLLKWGWAESFLIGSVLSSTDAASVFSILRARKLGLQNNLAPLLEVESGANDPCSYMLTVLFISIIQGSSSAGHIVWLIIAQIGFGIIFGLAIAKLSVIVIKKISFSSPGYTSLFILSIALLAYALPALAGGNGFLSTYIVGLVIGNSSFAGKKNLVGFFDSLTDLMQMFVFYMLGLLAHPANMVKVLLPSLLIFCLLLLISRPISIELILRPFRKYNIKQRAFVSFVGLRGASSIVFAMMASLAVVESVHVDVLNIVFCVVILSISIQGYFLPAVARKLSVIDANADVMKTFTDFSEEMNMNFQNFVIEEDNPWAGKLIRDLIIPRSLLICTIIRKDGVRIVPNGNTRILIGDSVITCASSFRNISQLFLVEKHVHKMDKLVGTHVRDFRSNRTQIVLIRRGEKNIIPRGDTVIKEDDILYLNIEPQK